MKLKLAKALEFVKAILETGAWSLDRVNDYGVDRRSHDRFPPANVSLANRANLLPRGREKVASRSFRGVDRLVELCDRLIGGLDLAVEELGHDVMISAGANGGRLRVVLGH